MKKERKILAISGSLREKSSNTALMYAIIGLAPEHIKWGVYRGLGDLPHFNPDDDREEGPAAVRELRTQIQEADAVMICTPEYGNGVPGVLKNALDWLVSTTVFMNKPTAVISASPTPMGGDKAHASLLLTLRMIHAAIAEGGTLIIPHISLKMNEDGRITDDGLLAEVHSLLQALERSCL